MESLPIILAVDDEPAALEALREALERRFGRDYEILARPSPEKALEDLGHLRGEGREVALVIADQWMPGLTGSELLSAAHDLAPDAKRALLVAWGDHRSAPAILQGCAFGKLDNYLLKPWNPPEVHLYPAVSEFLAEWTRDYRPHMELVRLVGEEPSARSHELLGLLQRSGIPTGFYKASSPEGRRLLDKAGVDGARLPVVILLDGQGLVDPSNSKLSDALGATTAEGDACDLAIVGAGPGGLAAAVYAASEGLKTVVIERDSVGGQAGTSSLIRNYLGFPKGLSGSELAQRAYQQAWLFGAQFIFAREALGLRPAGLERILTLSDGMQLRAKVVLIATGASYRRLGVQSLERFFGAGVFYSVATDTRVMKGHDTFVAGGGNSAGQAVVHLAKNARKVTLLVRGDSLEQGMSDYLVQEIRRLPNVEVRLNTEVVDGDGGHALEKLTVRDRRTGRTEVLPAEMLCVLIGADPHTEWLTGTIARDRKDYVLTGGDLDVQRFRRLVGRPPLQFETSMPGVFAVGDVRAGSVKRVTSAVGEGGMALKFIHEYLAAKVALEQPAEQMPTFTNA